jgi:hypothetical protein
MRVKSGQSVMEYAVLLAALCAVFAVMFAYVKNSVVSRAYVTQEKINEAVK